jgi:methionyl-tRNA formyltransferase
MIFVLTYNYPHKKTQDLLFKLQLQDYDKITVVSTPWVERKNFKPIFPHRIGQVNDIYPKELCKKLSFDYIELDSLDDFPEIYDNDYILIGGAGIIKKELADSKKIINSHPAYLPLVRGLDSMKWAIYNNKPLGVTSHIISEEADQGWLIRRKFVPLYEWDTFHSVAMRQYDIEIDLLASAVSDIKDATLESLAVEGIPVHRRMPHKIEREMISQFPDYVRKNLK